MKRATTFMVEKVAYKGGYVWSYLPDMTRRWGEMEATPTMIWIQPPGTPSMGHLFLDAYHATGDEYYYRAAEQVASRADVRRSIRRAAGTTSPISPARRRCGSGTTPSARTPGGSKSFSTTTATPPSTMPAPRNRRSSSCVCTSRRRIRNTRCRSTRRSSSSLDSQYPIGLWPQRFPQGAAASACTGCRTTPATRPSTTMWRPRTWIFC